MWRRVGAMRRRVGTMWRVVAALHKRILFLMSLHDAVFFRICARRERLRGGQAEVA